MTAPALALPRVLDLRDLRDPRRPGGLRGAPFPPDLGAGSSVFVWLADGQALGLTAAAEDSPAASLPWELVEWWIPIGGPPAGASPGTGPTTDV